MKEWTREVVSMTREQIDEAIKDGTWQMVRRSLKGMTTEEKLKELDQYCGEHQCDLTGLLPKDVEIQVSNYINALLRGGQLKRERGGQIVVNR